MRQLIVKQLDYDLTQVRSAPELQLDRSTNRPLSRRPGD